MGVETVAHVHAQSKVVRRKLRVHAQGLDRVELSFDTSDMSNQMP